MMKLNAVLRSIIPTILALGLASPAAADDTIPVTVSIVPQEWLIDSIGGEHVTADAMVEPGASPATYEPKPSQMRSISESEIYFSIGVPFENAWLPRMRDSAPDMQIVDMAAQVRRRTMEGTDNARDPHVWLSPVTMRAMASTVVETLSEQRPELAGDFRRNYAQTIATINAVDADIAEALVSVPDRTFMVYHPVWGYLADTYDLQQMAIETGGSEPSPQDMQGIIDTARANDIQVIFVQPQFSQRSAQAIAENLGGEVRSLNPLAYDWPENMRAVADTFAATLR
jgi:zinc transport system substrate-binding protein